MSKHNCLISLYIFLSLNIPNILCFDISTFWHFQFIHSLLFPFIFSKYVYAVNPRISLVKFHYIPRYIKVTVKTSCLLQSAPATQNLKIQTSGLNIAQNTCSPSYQFCVRKGMVTQIQYHTSILFEFL